MDQLNRIKTKIEKYLKEQNILATIEHAGGLVIESNMEMRLIRRETGKHEDAPTVVDEESAPAKNGFLVSVYATNHISQEVRPQEIIRYDPNGKIAYRLYLGTTNPMPVEGESWIEYNIAYGLGIKGRFIEDIMHTIEEDK